MPELGNTNYWPTNPSEHFVIITLHQRADPWCTMTLVLNPFQVLDKLSFKNLGTLGSHPKFGISLL